jgi:hypothetical protein
LSLKALAKKVIKETEEQEKSLSEKFVNVLDKFIVNSRSEDKDSNVYTERRSKYIRPSSYSKCLRSTWYSMLGFPGNKTYKAKGLRTLEIGTALHEWVQKEIFMRKNFPIELCDYKQIPSYGAEGIEFFTAKQNKLENRPKMEIGWIDKRWTKKYHLYSIIDGFLSFENLYMLFEFKTINPNDFKYLYQPLEENMLQASLYSLSTDIDTIMFLYINKGNSEWKPFEFRVTEQQKEWSLDRIQSMDSSLINLELPKTEPNKFCNLCPYKSLCDEDKCDAVFDEVDGFVKFRDWK